MNRWSRLCLVLSLVAPAGAARADAEALLAHYTQAARASGTPLPFSEERGRRFFLATHQGPNGEHSCASCHGPDPRDTIFGHSGAIRAECSACHPDSTAAPGNRSRIRRDIKPLAPIANPDRFADIDRAELWFDVNCFYVLGRRCTLQEKGDLITWLVSVK